MKLSIYQVKSGKFAGMYHVRNYLGKGKYFHIGRYKTKEEAEIAMEQV